MRLMRRLCTPRAWLLGLLWMVLPSPGIAAEATREVRPGERVRIWYAVAPAPASNQAPSAPKTTPRSAVGMLAHASGDSVTVLIESGGAVTIPSASITQIDRDAGTKGHMLAGALIGGGVCTALMLAAEGSDDDDTSVVDDEGLETAATVLVIGVGTLAGAFIGHLVKSEQWEPATLPGATVGISPMGATGVRIAAHFAF